MSETRTDNDRAVIGNNAPPKSAYELAVEKVDNVWLECKNWLDGSKVTTKAEADAIGNLLDLARKADAAADAARIAEKAPFDDKIAEIQARYAPLIANNKTGPKGKTVLAIAACKTALQPWLDAEDARIANDARIAREAAEAATRAAQAAIRAAPVANLEARAEAEELITAAKKLETKANVAEKQTAGAGGSFGRKIALRSVWVATMTDMKEAGRFYWQDRPVEMQFFFQGLADADVRAGKRAIPGFSIAETKVAV